MFSFLYVDSDLLMDFMESLCPGGGQVNRQRLEETFYVALSQLLYLWDVEEQRGRALKLSYGGKGKATNKRNFYGVP